MTKWVGRFVRDPMFVAILALLGAVGSALYAAGIVAQKAQSNELRISENSAKDSARMNRLSEDIKDAKQDMLTHFKRSQEATNNQLWTIMWLLNKSNHERGATISVPPPHRSTDAP